MFNIGAHRIASGSPTFIIAEIGTSHGGNLDAAEALIKAAKAAGADCVKSQLVFADEILHPRVGGVDLPGGRTDLYAGFRALERDIAFYRSLKEMTEAAGLVFLCSPFGLRSARMLREIGVSAIKIASPETNHYPLLSEVAGFGLPVIASTGVCTAGDIERLLSVLGPRTAILHCVTAYPAPEEEYNIRLIPILSRFFGVPAGVSDHSLDPLLVPVLSVFAGGCIIEKHFTLSRNGTGLDDKIALDPSAFRKMVDGVRMAETDGKDKTRFRLNSLYGAERINRVLGSGVKILSASEIGNYLTTKRSVLAVTDIEEGELFTEENTTLLRSEKNTRPGIRSEFHHIILGKPSRKRVRAGYGVTWDDVL